MILSKEQTTYKLTNLRGEHYFSNPRQAALEASTILSSRFVRHEVVKERGGRSYLLVDENGNGVRYVKVS
jgi:hypothetical protein